MKTSIEYITDLKTATRKWGHAILVVICPMPRGGSTGNAAAGSGHGARIAADTKFVSTMFSTWPQLLKNLVQEGGIPVAIFTTLKTTDGKVHFKYSVLEGWAKSCMEGFFEEMAKPYPAGEVFVESVDFDEFCSEDSESHDELSDEKKNREKLANAIGVLEDEE